MSAETMTCPSCRRPGLGVVYKRGAQVRGGRGGAIPRLRVPAKHKRMARDGTITDDWCPQGQPTRRTT